MTGNGEPDTLENAQRRAEYWKAEHRAANSEIERLQKVVEAARCICHWHDSANGGMVVSGEHVRALWQALHDLSKAAPEVANETSS